MAHFSIVELTSHRYEPYDWMDGLALIDNDVVNYYTDYVQDITEKERKDYLTWLPHFFAGIADVDIEKLEVTFKSKDEIEKTLESYYREVMEMIEKDWCDAEMSVSSKFYHLRCYGRKYKDSDMLIHFDGSTYTSMQFIEDAVDHAGETLYIGGIVDAHV